MDEFMAITVSSRKTSKQRRIDELLEKLADSDTLIVTELSRLGRSTSEVIALVNELVQRRIRAIVLKQNLDLRQNHDMTSKVMITLFSFFAEFGARPGQPTHQGGAGCQEGAGRQTRQAQGTIQASNFDKDRERIEELLQLGLSVRKIAGLLGYSNHIGLNTYVKRREIRESLV